MSETKRPFVLHTRVVTSTGGGPEKTILNSPRYLSKHGIDSACLFMRPPGDEGFKTLEAKAAAANAEIIGVDDRGAFDRSVVKECIRICRERDVDIWHAHDYKSNVLGQLVKPFHRRMHLVTTAHGWIHNTFKEKIYGTIDRISMRSYEQVICVAPDLDASLRKWGVKDHRLSIIRNAIIVDDYDTSPPQPHERRRFGFDDDHILLGACGRLSKEKGFDNLINAAYRLVRNGHQVGLLIAGDGSEREELETQIQEMSLGSHVQLVGFLDDPRELYRAIDIFVLSSRYEGLPNVVLEAMASARTVVATDVEGIKSLLHDGQNGIVVKPDSVDALYAGIDQALTNDELRKTLGTAARETVERDFSFAGRMRQIVDVYRSLSPKLSNELACKAASRETVLSSGAAS